MLILLFFLPLLYSIIIPCHREIILPWNQALPYFLERKECQPPSHRQSPTITLPCNANCMAVCLGFIHLTLYLHQTCCSAQSLSSSTALSCGGAVKLHSSSTVYSPSIALPCNANCMVVRLVSIHSASH